MKGSRWFTVNIMRRTGCTCTQDANDSCIYH